MQSLDATQIRGQMILSTSSRRCQSWSYLSRNPLPNSFRPLFFIGYKFANAVWAHRFEIVKIKSKTSTDFTIWIFNLFSSTFSTVMLLIKQKEKKRLNLLNSWWWNTPSTIRSIMVKWNRFLCCCCCCCFSFSFYSSFPLYDYGKQSKSHSPSPTIPNFVTCC